MTCRCEESRKPVTERAWRVIDRYVSHSAFNGRQQAASSSSKVRCLSCHDVWRTSAKYVDKLRDEGLRPGAVGRFSGAVVKAKPAERSDRCQHGVLFPHQCRKCEALTS